MRLFNSDTLPFSTLYNEKTFYEQFLKDLNNCVNEVVIESPYITASRMEMFYPVFQRLLNNKKKVSIVTRDPAFHLEEYIKHQSTNEVLKSMEMGIKVNLINGNHHRKLSIIDNKILWEGSLNILSQNNSREIMRRLESTKEAKKMADFLCY